MSATDVLGMAKLHPTLEDAIKDCVAAFALSARPREWSPQVLDVRSAAARAVQLNNQVAFVFGNETAGLTNEEMFACQFLVHIPASREFSSLNLAQAVQVVAYEIFIASGGTAPQGRSRFGVRQRVSHTNDARQPVVRICARQARDQFRDYTRLLSTNSPQRFSHGGANPRIVVA